jgi:S-adenosylmethionine hydrolase
LGLHTAPPGTLIYHNVAPREDDEAARPGNAGERLAYARLPTGVRVIGVNSGYTLSFIKDVAEKFRWAASPAEGSQFRSRDVFPQAAAAIALGLPAALGDEIDARAVPAAPSSVIAYVDGYGNLKTTIAYDAKKSRPGKRIRVRVNDHEHEATVTDGAFAVHHGELAFAPGSSGWMTRQSGELRWMEIFLRGGNAWDLFERPVIGSAISIA